MATTNITGEQFTATIEGNDIVLVDFWAMCLNTRRGVPMQIQALLHLYQSPAAAGRD